MRKRRWNARAAVEQALAHAASDAPAPEEAAGSYLLRRPYGGMCGDAFKRFWRMRRRVLASMPRPCRVCGATFADGTVSSVTCPTCKAAKRQRCRKCDRVFTVPTPLVKRCERCRSDRRGREVGHG